jgi:hypothetical protein
MMCGLLEFSVGLKLTLTDKMKISPHKSRNTPLQLAAVQLQTCVVRFFHAEETKPQAKSVKLEKTAGATRALDSFDSEASFYSCYVTAHSRRSNAVYSREAACRPRAIEAKQLIVCMDRNASWLVFKAFEHIQTYPCQIQSKKKKTILVIP